MLFWGFDRADGQKRRGIHNQAGLFAANGFQTLFSTRGMGPVFFVEKMDYHFRNKKDQAFKKSAMAQAVFAGPTRNPLPVAEARRWVLLSET